MASVRFLKPSSKATIAAKIPEKLNTPKVRKSDAVIDIFKYERRCNGPPHIIPTKTTSSSPKNKKLKTANNLATNNNNPRWRVSICL